MRATLLLFQPGRTAMASGSLPGSEKSSFVDPASAVTVLKAEKAADSPLQLVAHVSQLSSEGATR